MIYWLMCLMDTSFVDLLTRLVVVCDFPTFWLHCFACASIVLLLRLLHRLNKTCLLRMRALSSLTERQP